MARVTPQEYADKWQRRLSASTEDIRRGIGKVTTAPGQAAAANQDAMQANLNEAINSGRWASRVASVSLADWKDAALNKGVARVAAGAQAAQSKMQRVATELLPAVDAAAAQARALPKVSIEDSVNRAATFMRAMRNYKLTRR